MYSEGNVLIAYSWSINNIGDIGITPGVLGLLRETFPEAGATVLASQPPGDPAIPYLENYLPQFFPACKVLPNPVVSLLGDESAPGTEGSAWRRFYDQWGANRLSAFQNGALSACHAEAMVEDLLEQFPRELFVEIERQTPLAAEAFRGASFLLYNSGTTMNFGRVGRWDFWVYALVWALPLLIARVQKLPYGINGQSFEALNWPSELLYRVLFRDAAFVHCRDGDSLDYLRQRGLAKPDSHFTPDTTFFFQRFDDTWADAYLRKHGMDNGEFICVVVRIASGTPTYHDPVGGVIGDARGEIHMEKIKALIEGWIERTGKRVLLCPETRDAVRSAHDALYVKLSTKARERCVWMDSFWTTEQAYSVYRKARIVVSMEMHSIIMALSLATPVLHPRFIEAGRKGWMLRDLGLEDWLFDLDEDDADAMLCAALEIEERHEAAAARISAVLPDLKKKGVDTIKAARANFRPATAVNC